MESIAPAEPTVSSPRENPKHCPRCQRLAELIAAILVASSSGPPAVPVEYVHKNSGGRILK